MKKKLYISIAAIIVCVCLINKGFASNYSNSETSAYEKETGLSKKETTAVVEKPDYLKFNTDYDYKIFYGEWEATKRLGENYRLDSQDIGDIIGTKLFFSGWNFNFYYYGEKVNIDYPDYDITMIPLDENTTYLPYMPTLNEMGITGDYVTLFTIPTSGDVYFFVKDDETLIMFYKDAYIELKRTKYIPDYEFYYHAF